MYLFEKVVWAYPPKLPGAYIRSRHNKQTPAARNNTSEYGAALLLIDLRDGGGALEGGACRPLLPYQPGAAALRWG